MRCREAKKNMGGSRTTGSPSWFRVSSRRYHSFFLAFLGWKTADRMLRVSARPVSGPTRGHVCFSCLAIRSSAPARFRQLHTTPVFLAKEKTLKPGKQLNKGVRQSETVCSLSNDRYRRWWNRKCWPIGTRFRNQSTEDMSAKDHPRIQTPTAINRPSGNMPIKRRLNKKARSTPRPWMSRQ